MQSPFPEQSNPGLALYGDSGLRRVITHLSIALGRDQLVQKTTIDLQQHLSVDRVLLYYFYHQWNGKVSFEALSNPKFSLLGSTGPDESFNDEYAQLYLEGRVRAIADIETEAIADCHRDFLRSLRVRANLVVPILIPRGLWGLLVAHHCQSPHAWVEAEVIAMQQAAATLASTSSIRGSQDSLP